jgi:molybdopterin converting factor small subunit
LFPTSLYLQAPPPIINGWLALIGVVFGLVLTVGGAILILRSRAREIAHKATEDLLKRTQETLGQVEKELATEKTKVKDRDAEITELKEERDALKTAYTVQVGVNGKELSDFFYAVIGDVRYVNQLVKDKALLQGDLTRLAAERQDGKGHSD